MQSHAELGVMRWQFGSMSGSAVAQTATSLRTRNKCASNLIGWSLQARACSTAAHPGTTAQSPDWVNVRQRRRTNCDFVTHTQQMRVELNWVVAAGRPMPAVSAAHPGTTAQSPDKTASVCCLCCRSWTLSALRLLRRLELQTRLNR